MKFIEETIHCASTFFHLLSFECCISLLMGLSYTLISLRFFPMGHILSDLSTMTHPYWVAPRAWLSFIELDKAVVRVTDWLVVSDCGFSLSAL